MSYSHPTNYPWILSSLQAIVQLLLTVGADCRIRNSNGDTGLDIAKKSNHQPLVEILAAYTSEKSTPSTLSEPIQEVQVPSSSSVPVGRPSLSHASLNNPVQEVEMPPSSSAPVSHASQSVAESSPTPSTQKAIHVPSQSIANPFTKPSLQKDVPAEIKPTIALSGVNTTTKTDPDVPRRASEAASYPSLGYSDSTFVTNRSEVQAAQRSRIKAEVTLQGSQQMLEKLRERIEVLQKEKFQISAQLKTFDEVKKKLADAQKDKLQLQLDLKAQRAEAEHKLQAQAHAESEKNEQHAEGLRTATEKWGMSNCHDQALPPIAPTPSTTFNLPRNLDS